MIKMKHKKGRGLLHTRKELISPPWPTKACQKDVMPHKYLYKQNNRELRQNKLSLLFPISRGYDFYLPIFLVSSLDGLWKQRDFTIQKEFLDSGTQTF